MHTPPHLMLNLYAYVPLSNLSGWACYCDHQENRKSVIGREHLRVPSGVPLPASGLSAASGVPGHGTPDPHPHPHPRFAGDRGSTPIPIPDLPESGIQLSTIEYCKGVEFRLPPCLTLRLVASSPESSLRHCGDRICHSIWSVALACPLCHEQPRVERSLGGLPFDCAAYHVGLADFHG